MAPLPAPAEKPSHRVSDSQSHAKVRPPTQVAVFCAALWPNLQPALTLRIELEKPLALIETTAGTCQPDFLLSVVRPRTHGHLPVGPDDPPYLGRFDPRYLAQYVIEVMGFNDRKYEERKKRTHPRMERLGPVMKMKGREFESRDNDIDRQRETITADIALDLLGRWRRPGAGSAAA